MKQPGKVITPSYLVGCLGFKVAVDHDDQRRPLHALDQLVVRAGHVPEEHGVDRENLAQDPLDEVPAKK